MFRGSAGGEQIIRDKRDQSWERNQTIPAARREQKSLDIATAGIDVDINYKLI